MNVLKFGGTSVGSATHISTVISILKSKAKEHTVICVVSAVGGITNKLLKAGQQAQQKDVTYVKTFNDIKSIHINLLKDLIPKHNKNVVSEVNSKLEQLKALLNGIFLINELSPKTSDKLLSFGELLSSYIITKALTSRGINASLKNSQELIITNSNFTKAEVNSSITSKNIKNYFSKNKSSIAILPGFISKSLSGEQTTLGRGGSDYTAAIIAAVLRAKKLEIWTDVSGMYTTNPKLVKQAMPIKRLSYQEAMELSHFGAKVLYPPTIQPVLDLNIPIHIKNTLDPEAHGTMISNNVLDQNKAVKGISNINNVALLTLEGSGMIGIPGFSKRLFETLAEKKINIILITQASSEHSICFGIDQKDAETAKMSIDETFENEISLHKIDPISIEKGLSIIALIGDKMKSHQGISGKMFSTLGKNNVNVRAIAQGASEKNISAVINQNDIKKALNVLHERFFEIKTKQLNLFITGVGNVGKHLLDQIKQQKAYVKQHLKISLRVIGLSNSKKMIFNDEGMSLNNWLHNLELGEKATPSLFFEGAKALNLRNSVFVDVTANQEISAMYNHYLKENISVIACNKIACSEDYDKYKHLKFLSRKYNAPFLYETNVGAGLPIIDTLNHLITSGDSITSIHAVLSGSLNFIFNHFNAETKFHDVVKRAQNEGYTEPDPRIDLSGVDVARKILILARESGQIMNLEDIKINGFLTDNAIKAKNISGFYKTLIEEETHYQSLYKSAKNNNSKLKFVAQYSNGKANVGLQEIKEDHPFYNLEGKDNIVMFYTKRYAEQPMIIKGAGAGAEVTASGLFADIIRVANF